jgi:hypothetical protein
VSEEWTGPFVSAFCLSSAEEREQGDVAAANTKSAATSIASPTISSAIEKALDFYLPTGPVSGITTLAGVVWLVGWVALHRLWRNRQIDFRNVYIVILVLVGLGLLGCFSFFEAPEWGQKVGPNASRERHVGHWAVGACGESLTASPWAVRKLLG